MSFWSVNRLDLEDEVNEGIWCRSAALQADVRARSPSSRADVLQARLGGLPWVPDLVGRRWREAGAIHVVGSAYSPFIAGGIGRAIGLDTYRRARAPAEFLRAFVPAVVLGDRRYYEPLGGLIEGAVGGQERFVLTDLVRACFIAVEDEKGGDRAVGSDPDLFMAYARSGWQWTWRRFIESAATGIVALGSVVEHALLKLLRAQDLELRVSGRPGLWLPADDRPITTYASNVKLSTWLLRGWWWEASGVVEGVARVWRILPAYHPSWVNRYDPGYRATIAAVRSMLTGASIAPPASHAPRPSAPRPLRAILPPPAPRGAAARSLPLTAGTPGKQREAMRRLWNLHQPDRERVVREYARMEAAGSVERRSNTYSQTAEQYARRLLYDGLAKGWL
jgi:hypothetical protein